MDERVQTEAKQVTENIWQGPDGVYRWTYEFDMLKNPTILFTVWKVLGLAFGIVYVFTLVIDLFQGVIKSPADLWPASKVFAILLGVFFVIGLISYVILAALYGWKYQVMFEMTEKYVKHDQMPKQFKKAEAIGVITALVGAAAGKPYMVGLGAHTAARSSKTSELATVEYLKPRPKRNTIHVNHLLDKNQVYAEDADFDFVEQFLREHCTAARIK